MFHTDGELATARAAKAQNALQILSTQTSIAVEQVMAARGTGLWYQLYMPQAWDDTEKLVRRVEATGCPVLVWTIDLLGGRNLESSTRAQRSDTRQCDACHATATGGRRESVMFTGLSSTRTNPSNATWDWIARLKKMTPMKILIKGIETGDDARLAREHGADGIIISNHGGRAAETLRPTIDIVPEVVDAVSNRIPVLVDGGVRRGSDAFKALAYGARAVGIGRPYTWGLAAFGQEGVERVLGILTAELTMTMRQCGASTLARITRAHVARVR
jgi:isopentenyl diphosphate isomerase/L-lactate dehydrogenase-like FMN-dependent dehydrogenase